MEASDLGQLEVFVDVLQIPFERFALQPIAEVHSFADAGMEEDYVTV